MPKKQELSIKQKLYCHWLALGKTEREAAAAVGYCAEEAADAAKALSSPAGTQYRRTVEEAILSRGGNLLCARDGYYKLAFGDVSDALRLILRCGEQDEPDIGECPDLYNVSEIRRGKNGIELRFFDRIDALDRLSRLESEKDGRGSIYEALSSVAARLGEDGNDVV